MMIISSISCKPKPHDFFGYEHVKKGMASLIEVEGGRGRVMDWIRSSGQVCDHTPEANSTVELDS
jgi:hypothetical protein